MGKWIQTIRLGKERMLHLRHGASGPVITCVAVVGGAAPGLLLLAAYGFEQLGSPQPELRSLARWFFLAGGVLMTVVALLAAAEQAHHAIRAGRHAGEGD
jgi:hypothetical protein